MLWLTKTGRGAGRERGGNKTRGWFREAGRSVIFLWKGFGMHETFLFKTISDHQAFPGFNMLVTWRGTPVHSWHLHNKSEHIGGKKRYKFSRGRVILILCSSEWRNTKTLRSSSSHNATFIWKLCAWKWQHISGFIALRYLFIYLLTHEKEFNISPLYHRILIFTNSSLASEWKQTGIKICSNQRHNNHTSLWLLLLYSALRFLRAKR